MIPLHFGCLFSDRIEALLTGRVEFAGVQLSLRCLEAQALFGQVLKEQAFDLAELSMGSHIAAVGAGRRDYVGLPVFLSRSFRHGNLYIRSDHGIDRPEALAGKRIGLVDFQQTAALWLRGILADDYGVARESIEWVTGGLLKPVLTDRMAMDLPARIRVTRSSETLDALLASGQIDALISPAAPPCFTNGTAPVVRLWDNPREVESRWFAKTGIFPIMHVAVVRRRLLEAHPGLRDALVAGFGQALDLALTDQSERDFPKVAMPWLQSSVLEHRATTGPIWTYGVEANRAVLERMLAYARADGLIQRALSPDDLFA
jgi:4,5-dihydroxyphthalate decarboxylase